VKPGEPVTVNFHANRRPIKTFNNQCVAIYRKALTSAAARVSESILPLKKETFQSLVNGRVVCPAVSSLSDLGLLYPATAPALPSALAPGVALPPPSMGSYLLHPCSRAEKRISVPLSAPYRQIATAILLKRPDKLPRNCCPSLRPPKSDRLLVDGAHHAGVEGTHHVLHRHGLLLAASHRCSHQRLLQRPGRIGGVSG